MSDLLTVMRSRLGIREAPGAADNPVIAGWFEAIGHPAQHDETAWCAVTVGSALKACGYPIPPANINLLARSYLTYGIACEPKPGAIAIWPRGNSSWQGHVNVVERILPDGHVICIGGNQSDAVTRTAHDPAKALGFRWPVKAAIKDLRKAGSSTIKKADTLEKTAVATVAASGAAAAVKEAVTQTAPAPDFGTLKEAAEQVGLGKTIAEGAAAIGKLLIANPWLLAAVIVAGLVFFVARKIKAARLARAAAGLPLSKEV